MTSLDCAKTDKWILFTTEFIEQNLDKQFDTVVIAKQLGCTHVELEARFRAATGETVANRLLRLRLERAQTDLQNGQFDLEHIADRAGFASLSSFNRAFRKQCGHEPKPCSHKAGEITDIRNVGGKTSNLGQAL